MSAAERWNEPVFLVGAPRSGTTLLRNMLNRHPGMAIFRDSDFYHYVYRRRRAFGNLGDARNRQRLAEQYLSVRSIRRVGMDPEALAAAVTREGASYQEFFLSLLQQFARSQGKRRCGDKTHDSRFLGALWEWYPRASVIHLVRDPRDVVASMLILEWADQNVLGNAHLWLRCNRVARQFQDRPGYCMVRYEQLVAQPEEELRRICAFLGEEYSPAMLAPKPDPSADRAWLQRAEESVTTGRLGAWREQLTGDQCGLIEWLVGAHMLEYGYEPAGPAPSRATIFRGLVVAGFNALERLAGEFPKVLYSLPSSTRLIQEEAAKERFRSRRLAAVSTPKDSG